MAAWHYRIETDFDVKAGTFVAEDAETADEAKAEIARQHGARVEDVTVRRAGDGQG